MRNTNKNPSIFVQTSVFDFYTLSTLKQLTNENIINAASTINVVNAERCY